MLAGDHLFTQVTLIRGYISTQSTLAREQVSTQDMLTREHLSTQGMFAREPLSTQSSLGRNHAEHVKTFLTGRARNLAGSIFLLVSLYSR